MPNAALALVEDELSYDSLFAATTEPIVIVDSLRGSVISANRAAARLLGLPRTALVGMPLPVMLEGAGAGDLRAALEIARMTGVARMETIRFRNTLLDLSARLSLVCSGKVSYVLAHFSPIRNDIAAPAQLHGVSFVYDAIDGDATVMVVTDADLNLLYGNRAFLRLIEVDSLQGALGRALSEWLEFSGDDLDRMRAQMAAREVATTMSVRLNGRVRGQPHLQALAIAVPNGGQSLWGFTLTERPRIN